MSAVKLINTREVPKKAIRASQIASYIEYYLNKPCGAYDSLATVLGLQELTDEQRKEYHDALEEKMCWLFEKGHQYERDFVEALETAIIGQEDKQLISFSAIGKSLMWQELVATPDVLLLDTDDKPITLWEVKSGNVSTNKHLQAYKYQLAVQAWLIGYFYRPTVVQSNQMLDNNPENVILHFKDANNGDNRNIRLELDEVKMLIEDVIEAINAYCADPNPPKATFEEIMQPFANREVSEVDAGSIGMRAQLQALAKLKEVEPIIKNGEKAKKELKELCKSDYKDNLRVVGDDVVVEVNRRTVNYHTEETVGLALAKTMEEVRDKVDFGNIARRSSVDFDVAERLALMIFQGLAPKVGDPMSSEAFTVKIKNR